MTFLIISLPFFLFFFFFNDTATTEIYTLSLHDALPILKGNALSWDDPDGAAEAARLFEKAIEIDPGYGFPHALLASIWQGRWRDDPSSSDGALRKAFALAKRAVELDQNESTCFALLGWVELMRRSYDLALQHVRRAVEMKPHNQSK